MIFASILAALSALAALACLFGWPLLARGFDGLADWWSQPGQKALVFGLTGALLMPLILTKGELAGGADMGNTLRPDYYAAG